MKTAAVALALAWGLAAEAQVRVSGGVRGGVPLRAIGDGWAVPGLVDRSGRWTAGPTVEVDLARGFGVAAEALYRRAGLEGPAGRGPLAGQRVEFKDGMWDVPVLAKYRMGRGERQPYLAGGWTFRRLPSFPYFDRPGESSNGGTVSVGIRMGAKGVWLSPELRYTRWANPDYQPAFRFRKNQVEALLGVTFGSR